MKKVVLHVGLHKTATGFLQESVWPTADAYCLLTRPYTQNNHAFNQLQYADDSLYRRERVDAELASIAADRLLISDESLSGKPVRFSWINRSSIATRLRDLFPEAEVVLFLRDQRDIMASHYSSYVKMPYGVAGPEGVFRRPGDDYAYRDFVTGIPPKAGTAYYDTDDTQIHLDGFKYSAVLDLYGRLFPACHAFLYEDLATGREAILARLSEILGQPLSVRSDTRRNVSLKPAQLARRRRANRFSPMTGWPAWRRVVRGLMAATPVLAGPDVRQAVDEIAGDYFSEDNRTLRERFPELGFERHPGKYV